MSRKFDFLDDEEEEEEGANWQDSYSDLVTDLLAVFVILFSFAMMSNAATANANSAAKENILSDSATSEGIMLSGEEVMERKENFNELYESIEEYIEENNLEGGLTAEKYGDSQILLRVNDSVFFDSGQADIHDSAEPIMQEIADLFVKYDESIRMIRIEGHTDDVPINNSEYSSNWDLSVSRAVNVLREMVDLTNMETKKFSAVGYSEFYPINNNSSAEGRSKNRRVDFFIESIVSEEE